MIPMRFSASYFDGQSSHAHDVVVEWSGDDVTIEGDGVQLRLSTSDLTVDGAIGTAVRKVRLPHGALLESSNAQAVEALHDATGRRGHLSWVAFLEGNFKRVLALLSTTAVVVALGMVFGVPWLANAVAMGLPDALAHDIGKGTFKLLDESMFSATELDEVSQQRLRDGFGQMAEMHPELPLQLHFRKMGVPNAFALPDGTVVVTDELVALAEGNDDQVYAVLAHEIGHVHHRHGLRMALESASVALLISTYVGDASQAAAVTTALPTVLMNSSYSRSHETEADTFAMAYLRKQHKDLNDFADIMEKLQTALGNEGDDDEVPAAAYMSSHPPTQERINRFRAAAALVQ